MSHGRATELRIAKLGKSVPNDGQPNRYFIGLHRELSGASIHGALVRVWGYGLSAVADLVATARLLNPRIGSALIASIGDPSEPLTAYRRPAAELAEMAAEVIAPLRTRWIAEPATQRAVGALNFGSWFPDGAHRWDFLPRLDTALLAKLSEMTVVDDFPGRDQAHGGRGGPCEATGLWLMLADRGVVPGRIIRAVVDLSDTIRLFLLPPRQPVQLPASLSCFELGPGLALLEGLVSLLSGGTATFEPREQLAIQGRRIPQLAAAWSESAPLDGSTWSPCGADVSELLRIVADWPDCLANRTSDVLCTAIHWIADRVVTCIQSQLPRSQPIGQLVLAGPGRWHRFLVRQLMQQLPELDVTPIDDHGFACESWTAVAAAMLAVLSVDQVPGTTYMLTGIETPRILGRLTPGPPGNWHQILADMARTLPDKMTLRSAI